MGEGVIFNNFRLKNIQLLVWEELGGVFAMDNDRDIIDINHVVKLAKLDLNKNDSEHFSRELRKILDYIDMLKEADVSKINSVLDELDYDNLVSGAALKTGFYKDCRLDECLPDDSFDFNIVVSNAPNFDTRPFMDTGLKLDSMLSYGFFIVPQVIE